MTMPSGGFVDGDVATGGFHEEDHPRDPEGKFTGKPGGAAPADSEAPATKGKRGSRSVGAPRSGYERQADDMSRPGFTDITDDAELRAQLHVPAAYVEVWAADNRDREEASVMWIAARAKRDQQGKRSEKSKYTVQHEQRQLAEKFARNLAVDAAMPSIIHGLDKVPEGHREYEAARALRFITETGARVGGEGNESAVKDADGNIAYVATYGTTTLQARHITINPDGTAEVRFLGKAGKENAYLISDPEVADDLRQRKEAAAGEDSLVFDTNDNKMRAVLKRISGHKEFKVHDIRTWVATTTARMKLDELGPPADASEYWAHYDEAIQAAADQINDDFATTEQNYINPIIFVAPRSHVGLSADDPRPKRSTSE